MGTRLRTAVTICLALAATGCGIDDDICILDDPTVQAALSEVASEMIKYIAKEVIIPVILESMKKSNPALGGQDTQSADMSPRIIPLATAVTQSTHEAFYRNGVLCGRNEDTQGCKARFETSVIAYSQARVQALELAFIECRNVAVADALLVDFFAQSQAINGCLKTQGYGREVAALVSTGEVRS